MRASTWVRTVSILLTVGLTGCWTSGLSAIDVEDLPFRPESGADDGWRVSVLEVPLTCPDGGNARFVVVAPNEAPEGLLKGAVVYHSGSFDFVYNPDPADPLFGLHASNPDRLTSDFAVAQVFATLGMGPNPLPTERHDGSLAASLAARDRVQLHAVNCWGDLWGARRGGRDNDFGADFFYRDGAAAAEWAYRTLADPAFASSIGLALPFEIDPSSLLGVGLGEGSRAVLEVNAIDRNEDGLPDYRWAAALVDSAPDDLRVYFEAASDYRDQVTGLERVFPSGEAAMSTGSVWAAPTVPRMAYVYSSRDPELPAQMHAAAVERLQAMGDAAFTLDTDSEDHILTNTLSDPTPREQALAFLLDE